MQNLTELKNQFSDYAKDIKINLTNLINKEDQILSTSQIYGLALASAYATKNQKLIIIFENEAKEVLSESEINGVKTAAVLMAMNNIYYRFTHISSDKEYSQIPAGLRMQGVINHGIDKVDFEVFSLAVSIINGCGMCIDAHSDQLIKHGMSKSQIQMIAKIAAVINATAQFLTIAN